MSNLRVRAHKELVQYEKAIKKHTRSTYFQKSSRMCNHYNGKRMRYLNHRYRTVSNIPSEVSWHKQHGDARSVVNNKCYMLYIPSDWIFDHTPKIYQQTCYNMYKWREYGFALDRKQRGEAE